MNDNEFFKRKLHILTDKYDLRAIILQNEKNLFKMILIKNIIGTLLFESRFYKNSENVYYKTIKYIEGRFENNE